MSFLPFHSKYYCFGEKKIAAVWEGSDKCLWYMFSLCIAIIPLLVIVELSFSTLLDPVTPFCNRYLTVMLYYPKMKHTDDITYLTWFPRKCGIVTLTII